jgi:hypothetical protein
MADTCAKPVQNSLSVAFLISSGPETVVSARLSHLENMAESAALSVIA